MAWVEGLSMKFCNSFEVICNCSLVACVDSLRERLLLLLQSEGCNKVVLLVYCLKDLEDC